MIKLINQKSIKLVNYCKNGFKSHSIVCNDCDYGIKFFENFAVITVNGVGYRYFMFDMTEEDVISLVKNFEHKSYKNVTVWKNWCFGRNWHQ